MPRTTTPVPVRHTAIVLAFNANRPRAAKVDAPDATAHTVGIPADIPAAIAPIVTLLKQIADRPHLLQVLHRVIARSVEGATEGGR